FETIAQFTSIELPLRPFGNFQEALAEYVSEEQMVSPYACDTCSLQKVAATKQLLVDRMHQHLLLQLKRFSFYVDRGDNYVAKRFRSKDICTVSMASFVHLGELPNSGHYVSYVRMGSSLRFVEFNDEIVNVHDFSEENFERHFYGGEDQSGSTYLLFYEKVDEDTDAVRIAVTQSTNAAAQCDNDRLLASVNTAGEVVSISIGSTVSTLHAPKS
ncbi:hypothetical protein AAVH_12100, partial [Aphelenchoides avenae]